MKLINEALAEKNLKLKSLPQDLQDEINQHKELIVRYNMACEEYEQEEEEDVDVEKRLDAQEHTIASNETELAQRIRDFVLPEPEPTPTPAPTPAPVVEKKEEKGSSIGWLIFGGAALLVTLGAVNVFKKR